MAIQDELAIQLYTETLRLPEAVNDRRNGFARWVKTQREHLESWIDVHVEENISALRPQLSLDGQARQVAEVAEELISAQFRQETCRRLWKTLAAYAVHTYASRWTTLNLGESFQAGEPQHRSGIWLIPVFDKQSASWLTTLRLNATGESLSDPKALRSEIDVRLGRLQVVLT
ncbi:hypothetical protein [Armatimonas sp.]|uniref:hypothetical protein n=1 Tax=Armatimonas sp. TaxID=1872638 RepID=UPI00286BC709|nr:hypothetical protein [Armatimonas sp.]